MRRTSSGLTVETLARGRLDWRTKGGENALEAESLSERVRTRVRRIGLDEQPGNEFHSTIRGPIHRSVSTAAHIKPHAAVLVFAERRSPDSIPGGHDRSASGKISRGTWGCKAVTSFCGRAGWDRNRLWCRRERGRQEDRGQENKNGRTSEHFPVVDLPVGRL